MPWKGFVADKEYLNKSIVSLAAQWSANEPIVISTADAEGLKKYFVAMQKLLDWRVRIEQGMSTKSPLSAIRPLTVLLKWTSIWGIENYFKDFLRPQLEMLVLKHGCDKLLLPVLLDLHGRCWTIRWPILNRKFILNYRKKIESWLTILFETIINLLKPLKDKEAVTDSEEIILRMNLTLSAQYAKWCAG